MSEQVGDLVKRRRSRILLPYPVETERLETSIRGPLGIWNFPFLNMLLQFLYAVRTRQAPYPARTASRRVEYIRDPNTGRIIEKYEEIEF